MFSITKWTLSSGILRRSTPEAIQESPSCVLLFNLSWIDVNNWSLPVLDFSSLVAIIWSDAVQSDGIKQKSPAYGIDLIHRYLWFPFILTWAKHNIARDHDDAEQSKTFVHPFSPCLVFSNRRKSNNWSFSFSWREYSSWSLLLFSRYIEDNWNGNILVKV